MSNEVLEEGKDQKTCFIIMPISDHPDYSVGHFKRVYEFIIKPACERQDFKPVRADDVKVTNYIALDIIKQIIECDLAICDLSSKNPNVLYEAGIRQAFNLPITFIKDKKTSRIFDIQGFRDVPYDESLRIDTVDEAIAELSETIKNTFEDKGGVNSLISMLGIQPAKVAKKEISLDTELILNAIKDIKNQSMENNTVSNIVGLVTFPKDSVQLSVEELTALKKGDKIFSVKYGIGTTESNSKETGKIIISFESGRFSYKKESAHLYKLQ